MDLLAVSLSLDLEGGVAFFNSLVGGVFKVFDKVSHDIVYGLSFHLAHHVGEGSLLIFKR